MSTSWIPMPDRTRYIQYGFIWLVLAILAALLDSSWTTHHFAVRNSYKRFAVLLCLSSTEFITFRHNIIQMESEWEALIWQTDNLARTPCMWMEPACVFRRFGCIFRAVQVPTHTLTPTIRHVCSLTISQTKTTTRFAAYIRFELFVYVLRNRFNVSVERPFACQTVARSYFFLYRTKIGFYFFFLSPIRIRTIHHHKVAVQNIYNFVYIRFIEQETAWINTVVL